MRASAIEQARRCSPALAVPKSKWRPVAVVLRIAIIAGATIVNPLDGWADDYADCNQVSDPGRTVQGCSNLIARGARESRRNRQNAYVKRGNAYERLGRYKLALPDFSNAIRLAPDQPQAYFNRGLTFRLLGRNEQAIEDFSRVIALRPRDASSYFMRAMTYAMLGNGAAATEDLDRAIGLEPDHAEAHFLRGLIHRRTGRRNLAIADFKAALKIDPDHARAREMLQELGMAP